MKIPLFPLHSIILPVGQLHLRIFEPRYLDMLTACFRDGIGFCVCLIREGSEAGGIATPYHSGTLVRVADWDRGNDGLLNIRVVGEEKVSIVANEVMPDNLLIGEVQVLAAEQSCALPDQYRALAVLLERVFVQAQWDDNISTPQFDDALWVGSRLLELLPMSGELRQELFDCEDPLQRLDGLGKYIREAAASRN